MADGIKISELPEISTLQDGCCFPVISEIDGSMQNVKIKKVNLEKNLIREVYSTGETVIGKWIDGRPVYRKVYTYEATGTTSGSIILDSSIHPDNAALINCYGYNYRVSSETDPLGLTTNKKQCSIIDTSYVNLVDIETLASTIKGLQVAISKPEGTSISKYCWIIEYIKL